MEPRHNEVCSICLEPLYLLGRGQSLLSTPCDHLFHRHCLSQWFQIGVPGNCCPLCKRPMWRCEPTPVSLEQSVSVARRSTRTATMTNSRASASAASGRPTSSSSSGSRESREPPPPPNHSGGDMSTGGPGPNDATPGGLLIRSSSLYVENLQRDLQIFLRDQGPLQVHEERLRSMSQLVSDWRADVPDARERYDGIRRQFGEMDGQHSEFWRERWEIRDRFLDPWRDFTFIVGTQDGGRRTTDYYSDALGQLTQLFRGFSEFIHRVSEIDELRFQVLQRKREISNQRARLPDN